LSPCYKERQSCPRAEGNKLSRKTQPFNTVVQKYSPSDANPMTLTSFCSLSKRYLQWLYRKITEWPTVRASINHKTTRRDKTPAHTINVELLMASVGQKQVVDITPVWYLSITESRLLMLLQQFLPAIR